MRHGEVTIGSKIPLKQLKRVLLSITPWKFTPKSNTRLTTKHTVSICKVFFLRHYPNILLTFPDSKCLLQALQKIWAKNIKQNCVIGQRQILKSVMPI